MGGTASLTPKSAIRLVDKWRRRSVLASLGFLAMALLWATSLTQPWQSLEWQFFNLYTSLSAARQTSLPTVILAIDEPTFAELQLQWPFPRHLHAQVLERLKKDGALAVGFDIIFSEPSNPEDDATFARAVQGGTPVVLAATRERTSSANAALWQEVVPLDLLLQAGAITGKIMVTPDSDFVVRRFPHDMDSFASRIASQVSGRLPALLPDAHGDTVIPDLVNYTGPRGTIDTRSYYQALEPGLLPENFFKNKIVLIGRAVHTAAELNHNQSDMFNSPFALTDPDEFLFPGVELHANMISNLLNNNGLRTAKPGWILAMGIFMVLVVAGASRAHPVLETTVTFLAVLASILMSLWLFWSERIWLPPVFPVLAAVLFYGIGMLLNYASTRKRALRIRQMFSQYVPQEVVAQLVNNPELLVLGGETRELTMMFTDLANFTGMSEQLSAQETVDVLTEYFNAMTPIIHRYGGTIDKFIGDAIMAFWGAPLDDQQQAQHAVEAACDMQNAMLTLVQTLASRGLPGVSMRIGLHTGSVVVGNVGSQTRFSYTAIGDSVNLAARLEGANKAFGTGILLSEETAKRLPAQVMLRHLDTIIVKGKREPIRVFTPCNDAELCRFSAQALVEFYAGRWDESRTSFEAILKRRPGDLAALRFLQRIKEFGGKPPETGWSGALALEKL